MRRVVRFGVPRFVGRRAELDALAAAFRDGARLVTITGGPGIGKTRLAREYLAGRGRVYELGSETLAGSLARQIGTPIPDGDIDGFAYLADWLERHATQIVLDGVAPDHRDDIARLYELAPALELIVTAAEPLGIAGEHSVALTPLAPEDAKRLFLERAAAFIHEPSPDELRAIDAIVERLEGIPLVVELAAGLTASLRLGDLAARSVAWLDRVAGNGVLFAAIREALERLDPEARRVLDDCTVFDGFNAEAAEAVLGDAALGALARLVERAIIDASADRFTLRHAIRALVGPASRQAVERHADYYASLGRSLAGALTRTGDSHAQRLLALERGNLLAIAAADRPPTQQLEAILALDPLLRGGAPHADHHALLDRAIDLARAISSPRLAELLAARGELDRRRGHLDAALRDFGEASSLATATGEKRLLGRVMGFLAMMHHQAGQLAEAVRLATAAIACNREFGDSRDEGISRVTLGLALLDEDRGDVARPVLEETLVLAYEARDRFIEAMATGVLAQIVTGRIDDRRAQFARARALAVEISDRRTEGMMVGWLASLEHEAGELERARAGYVEAIALLQISNGYRFETLIRGRLSAALADLGHADEAVAERDRAAGMFRRVGGSPLEQSLHLHEGHIELLHARRTGEASYVEAATARLAAPIDSNEGRFAHRLLRNGLASLRRAGDTLEVEKGAIRFRLAGTSVSLVRRRALARLLLALVEAERGRPLTAQALIARGWPDEKLAGDSGIHRLRMAVATLRKLGLRSVLLTSGEGYMLDPAVVVRLL